MAFLFALSLIITCLLIIYKLLAWQRIHTTILEHGCQPPRYYQHLDPIFGWDFFLADIYALTRNKLIELNSGRIRKYGLTFVTKKFASLGCIESSDPANIHAIWFTKSQDWGVAPGRQEQMEPFAGRGFFTRDGAEWEKSRRLVKAGLHKEVVNDLEPLATLVDELLSQLSMDGSTVDLQPYFEKMFLDSATIFLLGESMGALAGNSSVDAEAFLRAHKAGLLGCGIRILLGPLIHLYPTSQWLKACTEFHSLTDKFTDRVIACRDNKDNIFDNKSSTDSEPLSRSQALTPIDLRRTLLYHMVAQSSDREFIRGTLIHTFLATSDSSAITLANIFWVLARQPALLTSVRGDIITVTAANAGQLSPHSLGQMRHLRNFILETMRLYPVIPRMNRVALRDTILPAGGGPNGTASVFAPYGTNFRANWHELHRLKRVWGQDAEVFRPGRWEEKSPAPWEFMPFGGGPRRCVGQEKAMLEIGYVVARLLQVVERVETRDERPWEGRVTLSAKNANGTLVGLFG